MKLTVQNFKIITCLALILGTFQLPLIYFSFLRVLVWGTALGSLFQHWNKDLEKPFFNLSFIAISILFQPFLPFPLGKGIWIVIDLITCLVFVCSTVYVELEIIKLNKLIREKQLTEAKELRFEEMLRDAPYPKSEIDNALLWMKEQKLKGNSIEPIEPFRTWEEVEQRRSILLARKSLSSQIQEFLQKQEKAEESYRSILYWINMNKFGPPYTPDEIKKGLIWENANIEFNKSRLLTTAHILPPSNVNSATGQNYYKVLEYLRKSSLIEKYQELYSKDIAGKTLPNSGLFY